MECEIRLPRERVQIELLQHNDAWSGAAVRSAPDGDADLESVDFSGFRVPACPHCGGVLKPDVVFFGESVPSDRVAAALRGLEHADALLVVGSSLMVYSGYRFVRAAARNGTPIAAVNLGRTRADELLTLKVAESCGSALSFLLGRPAVAARTG